jgi:hypothetical protein
LLKAKIAGFGPPMPGGNDCPLTADRAIPVVILIAVTRAVVVVLSPVIGIACALGA